MGLSILVVDDSSTLRTMVCRILRMSGLPIDHLYEAANGKEGLEVLSRRRTDVVLIDINMPVMNGLEMIERIHEHPELAGLPIVVVSSESSETRIGRLRRRGMAFVHKPFTPEKIREVLLELLGGPSGEDD